MRRLAASGLAVLAAAILAAPSVAADNHAPVAVDDPAIPGCFQPDSWGGAYPIVEDQVWQPPTFEPGWSIVFGACSPLANDSDPDGDPITLELEGEPAHGQAMWLPEGFLGYRPDADFSTLPGDEPGGEWISDQVPYRVSDGQATSPIASFRFWVAPINDPPSFTPGAESVESRWPWAGKPAPAATRSSLMTRRLRKPIQPAS